MKIRAKSNVAQKTPMISGLFEILRTRFKTFFSKSKVYPQQKITFQEYDSPLGKRRRSHSDECGRSFDQVHTLSLCGSKILYTEGRSPEFADGMDGKIGTGYKKCPPIFFVLFEYIEKIYVYSYMQSELITILLDFEI